MASTNLLRKPLPKPKSKMLIHAITDDTVSQIPYFSVPKNFIANGTNKKLITTLIPFKKKTAKMFFLALTLR